MIKSAAVITIKEPDKMTKRGRQDIAAWLRRTAKWLATDKLAGPTYRGRYIYTKGL